MKFMIVVLLLSLSAEGQEIRGRIFNGNGALNGQFKYIAAVLTTSLTGNSSGDWHLCGGSLIAQNWIMTAAHCLYGRDEARVYLGSIDRHDSEVGYTIPKKLFSLHQEFNPDTLWNDIALILIPKTKKCDKIEFVQLPQKGASDFEDKTAVTMGWGRLGDHGLLPKLLQWTIVKIMANTDCTVFYDNIIDSDLCVRTEKPYGSHCNGDSGGPLVFSNNTLIAIASSIPSIGCEDGNPTVFKRVSSYMPWIQSVTGISY